MPSLLNRFKIGLTKAKKIKPTTASDSEVVIMESEMGYYTDYALDIIEGDNDLISELMVKSGGVSYSLHSNGGSCESCKWYNHEIDLRNFSLLHPQALFKLKGEGEEAGDIWIEYYRAGKMQRCNAKITFDEFDCDELA